MQLITGCTSRRLPHLEGTQVGCSAENPWVAEEVEGWKTFTDAVINDGAVLGWTVVAGAVGLVVEEEGIGGEAALVGAGRKTPVDVVAGAVVPGEVVEETVEAGVELFDDASGVVYDDVVGD